MVHFLKSLNFITLSMSGSSVVGNTLEYQSRDSSVFRMSLKTKVLSPYDLVVGGTLNPS